MPTCVPADDAYLIANWPMVVVQTPEVWQVAILAALAGDYTVLLGAAEFPYTAGLGASVSDIQAGLLLALGGQMLAAIAPSGENAILVQAGAPGLTVTATGPAPDSISASLISGGDSNAEQRAFWLARALCRLPPCCAFSYGCVEDYTLMHASMAAHMILTANAVSGTGASANDFRSMRLGPASLARGASAWAANPSDGDLAQTAPGQLFLALRTAYVLPAMCV